MATLSSASGRVWHATFNPGTSESNVEFGNFWHNTSTHEYFICTNETSGSQTWEKFSFYPVPAPEYEMKSWTPVVVGTSNAGVGTYTTQVGRYRKVGNRIDADLNLNWTAHTGSGNLRITGLPESADNSLTPIFKFQTSNLSLLLLSQDVSGLISGTDIDVVSCPLGGAQTSVGLDSAAVLRASFSYFV